MGLLSHRANGPGVLIGSILGLLGTIAVRASRLLLPVAWPTPGLQYLGRISNFYYGFLGTLLTILAGYAASLLFPRPPDSRIVGLTRRSLPAPVESGETVNVS